VACLKCKRLANHSYEELDELRRLSPTSLAMSDFEDPSCSSPSSRGSSPDESRAGICGTSGETASICASTLHQIKGAHTSLRVLLARLIRRPCPAARTSQALECADASAPRRLARIEWNTESARKHRQTSAGLSRSLIRFLAVRTLGRKAMRSAWTSVGSLPRGAAYWGTPV
jgi:hypothetical protein